jgi:hypothetical protein
MNDEGLLANGVSATEEAKQLLDEIVVVERKMTARR